MIKALEIIRDEHRSLAAVIHGLQHLAGRPGDAPHASHQKVLRAMIHYIDTFPERLHHPKEDRYLFQAVRRRDPGAEQVLAELESQHVRGAALIRELERALLEWETQGDAAYAAFAAKVQEFADFHWKHMRQEEDVVMPLAEKILQPEDWVEIDAAFVGNKDPLFDKTVQKDFDKLFSHIVNIAPPPIGLGDAE